MSPHPLDEEGAALAADLAGEGLDVEYAHLDVRDEAAWAALADPLRVAPGRVDALVNNAGVAARERLPHVSPEGWRLAFDVNVTGQAYTASKWALRGLTRTASLELGGRGIRVNAVLPGLVDTPLMASASPAFTAAALAEIPLGRVGVPADIAPTIVFLVSDDAAYYNGAEIVIDGGLSAHVSHKRIADATRPREEPA
jgi:NAD(P)-dependent dehydrogenase (short-subunit alcohol dehydrogenase family)